LSVPCPNCGRLNRDGARYCASCQTPLGAGVARLQPGQLLDGGAYRVVRPLGKGGMGAVWLVAQTKAFDRLAVLKEVVEYFDPTNAAERQKAAHRFEAEARTLGDLKHPGIPDLYAYFTERDHNYLVMEYIEGPDLRKWLTGEDEATGQLMPAELLPADEVLRYTIQISQVLEYLARRQPAVVHNDIKPGNIIIDEHSGRAVLVDFGTAKTRYLRTAGQPDPKKASVYGTVGYAAPELYQGHSEPRSDVYSLAATAYHLLTDDDPRDHPGQYPQLDTLSPGLMDILRAALATEIGDRPTAVEFRQRLEGYLGGLTGPLRALAFPDGEAADEREELLALAIKHWPYAAGILHDGTMAHWLRRTLHDPVAAQAADAAVRLWPDNPDAALDAFIRQLSPAALPPGKIEMRTTSIRLSGLKPRQQILQRIEIANQGQGYLRGEVLSTQPWVKVGKAFACPPRQACTLPLEIDTTGLTSGQPYLAAVTLTPVGGTPEVVAVQINLTENKAVPTDIALRSPTIEISPRRVDFGVVDPKALSTKQVSVTVTNTGQTSAQIRVRGAPRWLLIKPQTFRLMPGAKQVVKLIGRVDKVRGRRQKVTLTFAVDGGPDQEIDIRLEVKRQGLFG
jgi:tRNA A-37 threonylcarbamoyl transferase component Bud32